MRFLNEDELEFYEEHCLLLPIVLVRWPRTYIVATNERGLGLPITRPKDLTSPDSLRRLLWHHANGLHPFDAERGNNPLLATPDCETFEPWKADEKATLSAPEGHLLPLSLVERVLRSVASPRHRVAARAEVLLRTLALHSAPRPIA